MFPEVGALSVGVSDWNHLQLRSVPVVVGVAAVACVDGPFLKVLELLLLMNSSHFYVLSNY